MEMNLRKKYLLLFYSACGKATPYIQREEQVNNSYWLISLMQGINLISLLFILNYVILLQSLSRALFLGIFTLPFIFNYYFFLRMGKKKIISNVDELVKDGTIKSKGYVIKYIISTIIFFILSALINNKDFQRIIRDLL
jgi:hypothetical protein